MCWDGANWRLRFPVPLVRFEKGVGFWGAGMLSSGMEIRIRELELGNKKQD